MTELPANAITHAACGNWWTGITRAHCSADGCHRTFTSDSAAEKHRKGAYGEERHCVDPETVGLIARDKPFGTLWGWPAPDGGYGFHAAEAEPTPGATGSDAAGRRTAGGGSE